MMTNFSNHNPPDFVQFVHVHFNVNNEALLEFKSKITSKSFKKGDIIVKKGRICDKIFFLEYGLVKTLFTSDSREYIMRFFSEANIFSVLDSFIEQKPSNYEIVALEDTAVSCISYKDLQLLCAKYHQIETFYRKLLSMAVIEMMTRIGRSLEETGIVAYNKFLKNQGYLLQRISLADLASYLGITQVSLSRIRGKN
ncbi:Crp/Fnr family transcriptional regulator [Sphingobacterium sp. UBA5996]|uniref:Crp/Fnr family transcriptional regulator n=1 Tax=Sphingobacterium sp. UBA5996 TaxID=1947505 RepID=UPI0025F05E99|nr:Crp/Fnr family transcriptional regulator [Sphingobacterium sp. UBA5996]